MIEYRDMTPAEKRAAARADDLGKIAKTEDLAKTAKPKATAKPGKKPASKGKAKTR